VRRSLAVGLIARGQRALELQTDGDAASADPVSAGSTTRARRDRSVVLYVHLSEDAIRSGDPDAPAWVENAGGQLLTAGQIAAWCAREESRVSVKPVIDLNRHQATDAYAVPERIAEQVRLRDRTCVHPFCQRPARVCDLDHIVPFDPVGPPGQTSTFNLALLCRRHHRLKTHGGWTYTMIDPGVFLWHSPYGHTWLRDRTGTTDLTPPSLTPPGPPPGPPPLEPPVDPPRRTS
jgi:5-methylcytosine-specific restriction endonuclease McrA